MAAAAGFVGAAVYFNRTAVDEAQASAAAAHSEYQRALNAYQAKLKQARDIEAEAKQRPATDVVRYSDNCTPVDDPAAITVIVSKTRCFNPKNWQPQDLVSIGDNERMRAETAKHYTEMKQAAALPASLVKVVAECHVDTAAIYARRRRVAHDVPLFERSDDFGVAINPRRLRRLATY